MQSCKYAEAAQAFIAGIKCQHCRYTNTNYYIVKPDIPNQSISLLHFLKIAMILYGPVQSIKLHIQIQNIRRDCNKCHEDRYSQR